MKNVQISFDEDLLKAIDRFAMSSRLTRSAVVREAVKTWVRQKKVKEIVLALELESCLYES